MPDGWHRQIFQSIVQFLIVFFTGMLVYDKVPTSWDQVWQPFVQGVLGALSIWAVSRASVGGAGQSKPATLNPSTEGQTGRVGLPDATGRGNE